MAHTGKHWHHGVLCLGQEDRQSGEAWPQQGFGAGEGRMRGRLHSCHPEPLSVKSRSTWPLSWGSFQPGVPHPGLWAFTDCSLHLEQTSLTFTIKSATCHPIPSYPVKPSPTLTHQTEQSWLTPEPLPPGNLSLSIPRKRGQKYPWPLPMGSMGLEGNCQACLVLHCILHLPEAMTRLLVPGVLAPSPGQAGNG